ncbi:MAG: carboxypeptidase regulatory-like domain-containing protein [Alphaproteobacteria bacterium]|nr:carboxypeptidase regulatory-like domain-containing protein [Alphaproteobacteria bacterium]
MRSPLPRPSVLAAAALLPALLWGCAGKHEIQGSIIDRNGEPMDRVIVSLDPGGVELVTDSAGQFSIDYLRDEAGERVKLGKKADYTIEAFRTGYHVQRMDFYFKRGLLVLEPITMKEDTIILKPGEDDIDPENFEDRTHSAGSNYEGE